MIHDVVSKSRCLTCVCSALEGVQCIGRISAVHLGLVSAFGAGECIGGNHYLCACVCVWGGGES